MFCLLLKSQNETTEVLYEFHTIGLGQLAKLRSSNAKSKTSKPQGITAWKTCRAKRRKKFLRVSTYFC